MARKNEINWDQVRLYFITQTANVVGDKETLRSVAERFNIDVAGLSRKARVVDENKKNWYDYRNDFIKKSMVESGTEKIDTVVKSINTTKKILDVLKLGAVNELKRLMQNEDEKTKYFKKMSVRDLMSILKIDNDVNLRLLEIYKSGINKKGMKINLIVKKDPSEMTDEELESFNKKIETFDFKEGEYEIVEED